MIGETIEKYEILEEIGQGGMAAVYRARDLQLKREVAIKILYPHLTRQKEAVSRFQREAVTVAKLHHPNIIDIYDYSGTGSTYKYIVTELIDGMTLGAFMDSHQPIPCELVACIGREICQALVHAHQEGIVHRDLKPENVMIRQDGKIKLMDFGIARVLEGTNFTVTGSILGSPAFMSPEQITGKAVDFSSDLFSLGSILYQMVTGVQAFKGRNPHEILKKVVEGKYSHPQQVNPSVSNEFSRLIEQLLATDLDQRYKSAGALLKDLDDIIATAEIDVPGREINRLFSDTKSCIEEFNSRLVENLEKRASARFRKSPTQAMQLYSRICAINPEHVEAQWQIERLLNRDKFRKRLRILIFVGLFLISLSLAFSLAVKYLDLGAPVLMSEDTSPLPIPASFSPHEDATGDDAKETGKAGHAVGDDTKKKVEKTTASKAAVGDRKKNSLLKNGNSLQKSKPKNDTGDRKTAATLTNISGWLEVVSVPWSDIYVNDVKVGSYPIDAKKKFPMKGGENKVRLVNPTCTPFTKVVTISKQGQDRKSVV